MAELFRVFTVEAARSILSEHLPQKRPGLKVPLLESLGRCLAEDVTAVQDVPGFNRSTMDETLMAPVRECLPMWTSAARCTWAGRPRVR